MGTKVHGKNYLPGYCSMRDINEDTGKGWPQHCEDKTLNGQFCNGFTRMPFDGYLDYDREVLKQTMLMHEETFRKQVHELHRLYKKQRDLMEEIKRNGVEDFPVHIKPFQSGSFSTQLLPNGIEKSWQLHGSPSKSSRATSSGAHASKTCHSSSNGSTFDARLISKECGSNLINQLADSVVWKHPKKMLDLELPADAYMDDEDADYAEEKNDATPLFGSTDPRKRKNGLQSLGNVNLTHDASRKSERIYYDQNPCIRDEAWKPGSGLTDRLQHNLTDLNEPLKDVSSEEANTSSAFPLQMAYFQDVPGQYRSMESVSSFRGHQKDLFHDKNNGEDGPVCLHVERGDTEQKWSFLLGGIGQSSRNLHSSTSSISSNNVSPLSGPLLINPSKPQYCSPLFLHGEDKAESWFRQKQHQSIETCNRNHHIASEVYSGSTTPTPSSPHHASPAVGYDKTSSQSVLPWKNPLNSTSNVSTASQALSFYGASVPTDTKTSSLYDCNKWQHTCDSRSTLKVGDNSHVTHGSFFNSFQFEKSASMHLSSTSFSKVKLNDVVNTAYEKSGSHGSQISLNGTHRVDMKTSNGIDLNLAPPSEFRDGFTPKVKIPINADERKQGLPAGMSWLRSKKPCREPPKADSSLQEELSSVREHSQPMPSVSSSLTAVQGLSQLVKAEGTEIRLNEATTISANNSQGFYFSHSQKVQHADINFSSPRKIFMDYDAIKNIENQGAVHPDFSHHNEPLHLVKQINMEMVPNGVTGMVETLFHSRGHINLNLGATSMDEPIPPLNPSEDEIKPASPCSIRGIATRSAPEIDLEAPPSVHEEGLSPPPEPVPHVHHLVQEESRSDPLETIQEQDAPLARIAAETICMISWSAPTRLGDASSDILPWFADLVTSHGDHPEKLHRPKGARDPNPESSDVDGMDYFEYMTLNLPETRTDDLCCVPAEVGQSEEDEAGVAYLLLGRPRRGPARRRRQRRDFQRDILPGLASLSRQEVAEDMQVIGGLMKASGLQWKAGGARRTAGGNRPRRQARGGQQPRGISAAVEAPERRRPRQANKQEARRSIVGWGRTTKRRRRRRCPPRGASPSPPS